MRTDGAMVTIVGRVANQPTASSVGGGDRTTLRVVSTERRFDQAENAWVDGDEFGVNVVAWRRLALGTLAQLRKGDPVVVLGRIHTRRYERNGQTEWFTEVKADVIALDVNRVGFRIERTPYPGARPHGGEPTAGSADGPIAEPEFDGSDEFDEADEQERDVAALTQLTQDAARPLVPVD